MKSILGNPLILATAGGVAFGQAGLALPGSVDSTLELLSRASLPHSTVAYLLAVRMGGDGQVSANQITVTTLLSMLTLPFWLSLAGG